MPLYPLVYFLIAVLIFGVALYLIRLIPDATAQTVGRVVVLLIGAIYLIYFLAGFLPPLAHGAYIR
jgi:hypothetical protein